MELVRHRQTKEAATDRFHLQPPRHIPTLPKAALIYLARNGKVLIHLDHSLRRKFQR